MKIVLYEKLEIKYKNVKTYGAQQMFQLDWLSARVQVYWDLVSFIY